MEIISMDDPFRTPPPPHHGKLYCVVDINICFFDDVGGVRTKIVEIKLAQWNQGEYFIANLALAN